ncbi:hypothetical protein HHK36_016854 [Tetracentron sinense]|uniref:Uncharacterized protein n=1 Tax=Tetracentron sinense TaxID=13715 RepID=A0A834Z469_TETSI|nr:hypothetical protein HHK36_016854 [Tetracentron sinense]
MYQEGLRMIGNPSPSPRPSPWSRLQDKLFERALVIFPDDSPDRWQKVAGQVPGKSPSEVKEHYTILVQDVLEIDSGRVELPCYADNSFTPSRASTNQISFGLKSKQIETERKKGIPWTEEEHRFDWPRTMEADGAGAGPSGRVELPCYADNSFTPRRASTNQISFGLKSKQIETERKKGIPWTEEEHSFDWPRTMEADGAGAGPSGLRMIGNPSSSPHPSPWSRLQDKLFKRALVIFPDDSPDRWQKVAGQVPGKSPLEVKEHHMIFFKDVLEIDSGRVELPCYADNSFTPSRASTNQISFGLKSKQIETERKKGIPWTEEEHRLFLFGLQRFGKGDWRSISRNAVVSRTPTQVASHAQKYFLRMNSEKKEKKRSSIHDITTAENTSTSQPSHQNWTLPVGGPVQQAMDPTLQFLEQGGPSGYQPFGFPM